MAPTGFDSSFKRVKDRCTKTYVTQKFVAAESFPDSCREINTYSSTASNTILQPTGVTASTLL